MHVEASVCASACFYDNMCLDVLYEIVRNIRFEVHLIFSVVLIGSKINGRFHKSYVLDLQTFIFGIIFFW